MTLNLYRCIECTGFSYTLSIIQFPLYSVDRDYGSVDSSVTFSSGESVNATRTIHVNITDDLIVEDDESFSVTITSSDPVMFGISTAQVTIIEDSNDSMSREEEIVLLYGIGVQFFSLRKLFSSFHYINYVLQ